MSPTPPFPPQIPFCFPTNPSFSMLSPPPSKEMDSNFKFTKKKAKHQLHLWKYILSTNEVEKGLEDMYYMTHCVHYLCIFFLHIVESSSFSSSSIINSDRCFLICFELIQLWPHLLLYCQSSFLLKLKLCILTTSNWNLRCELKVWNIGWTHDLYIAQFKP
jgi:hypothetical protein